jgi:hypothetical protein
MKRENEKKARSTSREAPPPARGPRFTQESAEE